MLREDGNDEIVEKIFVVKVEGNHLDGWMGKIRVSALLHFL